VTVCCGNDINASLDPSLIALNVKDISERLTFYIILLVSHILARSVNVTKFKKSPRHK
jgi:hypothetical protein